MKDKLESFMTKKELTLKNNQGILNLTEKKIYFKFNDENFVMDLTEGDLPDSWNSFTTKDGVVRDLNFHWEGYSEGSVPNLTIYELRDNGDGTWSTDFYNNSDIDVEFIEVIGTEAEYFNIPFNGIKIKHFEVFDSNNQFVLKTKKFNKACDESIIIKGRCIAEDIYGNRKQLN